MSDRDAEGSSIMFAMGRLAVRWGDLVAVLIFAVLVAISFVILLLKGLPLPGGP